MSHNPTMNYGYAPHQNYYMGEPEPQEYMAEYSDNEHVVENPQLMQTTPHSNITEIYSRKAQAMPPQHQIITNDARYHQNQKQYMQQSYYDNSMRQLPRSHMPCQTYPHQEVMYDPRVHQYCPLATASQHDTNYDSAAYRSAHHELVNQPRHYQEMVHAPATQKQPAVKRYPITVGTPKYYRKPPPNAAVFKRPSALCLPVASQPDPAVYRRPRKLTVNEGTQFGYQQHQHSPQQQHQQIPRDDISYGIAEVPSSHNLKKRDSGLVHHKMDSEGDVNVKIADLDDMFDSIEKGNETPKTKSKSDIAKFARYLKPRVPASIKVKHEKMQRLKAMKVAAAAAAAAAEKCGMGDADLKDPDRADEPDVTPDSLEKLLNQLKKCELAVGKETAVGKCRAAEEAGAKASVESRRKGDGRRESNANKLDGADEESPAGKSLFKSFNYQDITQQMMRSQNELKSYGDSPEESSPHSSIQDITNRIASTLSDSPPHRPRLFAPKPPLDDNCALELHRSKSYIVNLIDRALSKELGTVPNERRKEFDNMNPKKAINVMNRHTGLCDKEFCFEITSALTDSIISNATAPDSPPSSSKTKVCCCGEEPSYIKQLKQLRWGHLKHIQREVRRLEDLERFLDACSLNTISEL